VDSEVCVSRVGCMIAAFSRCTQLLSNLHHYGVVAASARSFSPLDFAASPLDFQSHLTTTYRTFH